METTYRGLRDRFDELEEEVLDSLRFEIEHRGIESQTVATKCIKVNVFDYKELAIIHGELTFIDDSGLQYGLYTECSLEDLIDILTKIE